MSDKLSRASENLQCVLGLSVHLGLQSVIQLIYLSLCLYGPFNPLIYWSEEPSATAEDFSRQKSLDRVASGQIVLGLYLLKPYISNGVRCHM